MTSSDPRLPHASLSERVARVVFCDPARRNALDLAALDALAAAVVQVHEWAKKGVVDALVVAGEGPAFCAGFDLSRCADEPPHVAKLLERLSVCVGSLRGLDIPVVARVQGAALAGGCALLTACDFVVVARDAQLGYPTHRIGISPAVSAPSLRSRTGGRARAFLLANELVDGDGALALGLATEVVDSQEELDRAVESLLTRLLSKGPRAMRATKAWIREIEARGGHELGPSRGLDAQTLRESCAASVVLARGDEFASMLRAFWAARAAR